MMGTLRLLESIQILNHYRNSNYNSANHHEVLLANAIDEILPEYIQLKEKNTPKKVIKHTCPSCKEFFVYKDETPDYCKYCGQRLFWNI